MSNRKWMLQLLGTVKWGWLLALVLLIFESQSAIYTYLLQKQIVDDVFVGGRFDLLPQIVVLYLAATLVSLTLFVVAPLVLMPVTYKLQKHLTLEMLQSIYRLPMGLFQSERTAKYVNYFSNDVWRAAFFLAAELCKGVQSLFTLVVFMVLIGIASPSMLVFTLLCCAAYVYMGRRFGPKLKRASHDVQGKRADFLVTVEEGISSTREVIAYHRMAWETERYNSRFKTYFAAVLQEVNVRNRMLFSTEPLRWVIYLMMLFYGGYQVLTGDLTIGTFVLVYRLSSDMMWSFQEVFNFAMSFSSNLSFFDRLRSVLDAPKVKQGDAILNGPVQQMSFEGVRFSYSEDANEVLKGLDLEIPLGRKVAFVGTSGGGKSTLAQLLVRFFEPNAGQIIVNGTSLSTINRQDWMSRLAIVFQDPFLFPDTIRMNLTLGREGITDEEIKRACQLAEIDRFLATLEDGYDTLVGERGVTLSGGQRQRLALARAILQDPEILILDEATSALDLETERAIQRNIDHVRTGRTTLIIAHRLSTIQNAELIVVMDGGRVADIGTHEELLGRDSVYKKLYHAQAHAEEVGA